MPAKTIGDLAGWTQQYFDFETVNTASTDWTPTKASATAALMCITAGTPTVDTIGVNAQNPTINVAWPLALTVGQVIQIAVTKVHKTGTTGTYLALY